MCTTSLLQNDFLYVVVCIKKINDDFGFGSRIKDIVKIAGLPYLLSVLPYSELPSQHTVLIPWCQKLSFPNNTAHKNWWSTVVSFLCQDRVITTSGTRSREVTRKGRLTHNQNKIRNLTHRYRIYNQNHNSYQIHTRNLTTNQNRNQNPLKNHNWNHRYSK